MILLYECDDSLLWAVKKLGSVPCQAHYMVCMAHTPAARLSLPPARVCQVAGVAAGNDSNPNTGKAVSEGSSGLRSAAPQGAGPRIYVGGIPNAVSETMVRKYFSNWGKVRSPTQHLFGQRLHSLNCSLHPDIAWIPQTVM